MRMSQVMLNLLALDVHEDELVMKNLLALDVHEDESGDEELTCAGCT